ncbi:peroxide stress protein YaaA [Halobacteriovorax sp. GB3]|uniref:peroxide stress protein YaaA n=1 Tax=Halobacteriovorax sp. GB3 TaxID=2719615 RepID=UPI00235FE283|nr:peroxide stress protein YaaA [Halobacteriovorax sp. GB3]MDD0852812.1 peroxide stress protein YaaA [Halobacteriovorax sp. GB3]
MKIIVSPAKKLDFDEFAPVSKFTSPKYLDESKRLINVLRKYTESDIAKLMKLSDSLAKLNVDRYKSFNPPFDLENAKQAMYAFQGDTYKGLRAVDFSKDEANYAQKSLRILSGLYGVLRPLDLIQPYRLEMGTKLPCEGNKNLYGFWKDTLTEDLNKELKKDKDCALINLASKEYFSSLDFSKLSVPVITCHFMEKKNDGYKVVGLFAKRARGMMSRYIIENQITKVSGLKDFNEQGYLYDAKASDDLNLVFKRDQS